MLQYRAVYPQTLELLKQLMRLPEISDFYLVGGTALALQIGHRISVDLDFFTKKEFSSGDLKLSLEEIFPISSYYTEKNSLTLFVRYPQNQQNTIKVDFLRYGYPLIRPLVTEEGLRLAHVEDIIPLKLSAIANRGSKKDFYDFYFLLERYSISEMLDLFKRKFKIANIFHLIKSLVYFDDAEEEPNPILIRNVEWSTVKEVITEAVKKYLV